MRWKDTWTTTAGAVLAATVASACCIGPALVGALGIGSAGLATAFTPYRPYLLGLTGALLAGAFALTYRRRPGTCGSDGSCRASNASRRQKLTLWAAAGAAIAVATYPYWGGGGGPVARAVPTTTAAPELLVELAVTGMTCDACARHVESALVELSDVQGAAVSYERGTARITLARDVPPEGLIQAIERVGYKASVRKPGSAADESQSDARREGEK